MGWQFLFEPSARVAVQRQLTLPLFNGRSFRALVTFVIGGFLVLSSSGAGNTISSFQAGDGGWHLGALAVGNVDDDPLPEIVVPYRDSQGNWFLDAYKWDGTRVPGFPYSSGQEEMNVSPTLYDLTGDGKNEIIITRGNAVIALRGNGSLLWSNAVHHSNYVADGGYQATTNGFYWSATGQWQARLPSTAVFSSQVSPPIVADITGMGKKEVVTAWKINPDSTSNHQDYNPYIKPVYGFGDWGTVGEVWSGGVVFFDAATGERNFTYHIHQLVEAGLAVGQADDDTPLEVYVLNDSDSVVAFDKTRPHGLFGKGMLHKQFGKNARMMSGAYLQGVDIYAADIDGDGFAELLAPTTQFNPLWQPHETLLDDNGAVLWRKWKQPVTITNRHGWFNSAAMIPVNPDGDNRVDLLSFTHSHEISFRHWNGVAFVDHAGWPKDFFPFLPTPPVVGDVDGDGHEDIVIGTYNPAETSSSGDLLVFALDGTLKRSVPVPGGLKHIPTLADANGDGALDVIYRSLTGRIHVKNFGATGTNRVSWATHRGNAQRDGHLGRSLFPPGTPVITRREGGYKRAEFAWRGTAPEAEAYRIFRASRPEGPFHHIATVPPPVTAFTDTGLNPGAQYVYEIGAVLGSNTVRSAPFAITCTLEGNLIVNGGFEADDNSNWDKWFTGTIPMSNMVGTASEVFQGSKAMEIILQSRGNNATISQYAQYGIPDSSIPVTPGVLYSFGGFIKSGGLTQPSRQWFEWTSTKDGRNTNNRPSLPWPNYFTPHLDTGTNAIAWTYANRVFTMPAGIPNVELRHRYTIDNPGSGSIFLDDLFFRPLPDPDGAPWIDLLPFGSNWRYASAPPPDDWFAADFVDTNWMIGAAKFGAGSGPADIVTRVPPRNAAYYFRGNFALDDTRFDDLLLAATCTDDDGGVVSPLEIWINGVELQTSGIEAVSGAGNEVKYYDLTPFLPLLKPGSNTIAVRLNNTWQAGWDNVAFDISLRGIPVVLPPSAPRLEAAVSPSGEVSLALFAQPGTMLRLETAGSVSGPWSLMEAVMATDTNSIWILDVARNDPPLPGQASSGFYRVVPY